MPEAVLSGRHVGRCAGLIKFLGGAGGCEHWPAQMCQNGFIMDLPVPLYVQDREGRYELRGERGSTHCRWGVHGNFVDAVRLWQRTHKTLVAGVQSVRFILIVL